MRPETLVLNRAAVVLTVALVVSACSVPLKDRAVRQVQAIDAVLSTVQDTEISLFESGAVPALTTEKHRAVHAALGKAFDAVERLAVTLRSWRAGDPVPNDVTTILEAAREAIAVLETVLPEASTLLTAVSRWVETALALDAIFRGGGA